MDKRCSGKYLTQGSHIVYVEGFQAGGGVGMEITYSGPDTQSQEAYMRVGAVPSNQAPASQYYPLCDPSKEKDWSSFTICMFRSEVFMWSIPAVNRADDGKSRLYFAGKAQLSVVDMHQVSGFRQYVPNTPESNYVWVIYGQLKIGVAGTYTLCISSDDG